MVKNKIEEDAPPERSQGHHSNAGAPPQEPRKPLAGRRMTKGQRAMAVAKIYPEPEKDGRGNKTASAASPPTSFVPTRSQT